MTQHYHAVFHYRNLALCSANDCCIRQHFQHTDGNVCNRVVAITKFGIYFCIGLVCVDCSGRRYRIWPSLKYPLAQLNVVNTENEQTSAT